MIEVPTREMPVIATIDEHSSIRLMRDTDDQRLHEILETDPDIRNHIGWVAGANTVAALRQRIVTTIEPNSYKYGIVEDGILVGYVGLWPSRKSDGPDQYDIGYFVDKPARGRGLVDKAVKKLMEVASQSIEVDSFTLFIRENNTKSQAVARRLGFAATDFIYIDNQLEEQRRYIKFAHDQAATS